MSTAERLMTADEFYDLGEPIEGGKMELVDGRSVTMSPVGVEHGEVSVNISAALRAFVRSRALGSVLTETGFRLRRDPDLVRAPDVSFVIATRMPPRGQARLRYFDGQPDLAIEVSSPDDREDEIAEKTGEYLSAGAERVWIVRPRNRTVTVHRPGGDPHTYSADDVLTSADAGFSEDGFSLPLPEIFA
jgi:Uma2 family endonuclease